MIFGIGTDVCDVRRIRATWLRRGERFAQRVLGPQELLVFEARLRKVEARGISYLATRFSAKEAFSKAIGLGMHMPMSWRACEILNLPSGQPVLRLHGALAEWFEAHRLVGHVTVSDETDYATSFVVVETKNKES
ncbi:holo-ACP synthase [Piscinibacter sakaiensis]|uniref:holo-ACP synthase n=1 Tax=Piscinibacter sakaiensis TaxID=1547922 RepID=UPI003AAA2B57